MRSARCKTGLGIIEAIKTLNTGLEQDTGLHLAVRVGIHTGLVVVGEMSGAGRQENLALGDTPNIAARLQGLAQPDTVVISDRTARLVAGYFTRYPSLALSPQRHKQKTLETLLAILLEQAARHPTMLIVEDLHWVDPTTVE
jgi:class 3 adenylate cyclase